MADSHHLHGTSHPEGKHKPHSPEGPQTIKAPPGTIYTCPMHPQVRQAGPGHCPICGMTLEPAN
jgi:Cu+-exporting ATPase